MAIGRRRCPPDSLQDDCKPVAELVLGCISLCVHCCCSNADVAVVSFAFDYCCCCCCRCCCCCCDTLHSVAAAVAATPAAAAAVVRVDAEDDDDLGCRK